MRLFPTIASPMAIPHPGATRRVGVLALVLMLAGLASPVLADRMLMPYRNGVELDTLPGSCAVQVLGGRTYFNCSGLYFERSGGSYAEVVFK